MTKPTGNRPIDSPQNRGFLRLLLAAKFSHSGLDEIRQIAQIDVPENTLWTGQTKSIRAGTLVTAASPAQFDRLLEIAAGHGFVVPSYPTPENLVALEQQLLGNATGVKAGTVIQGSTRAALESDGTTPTRTTQESAAQRIFIVHGHDAAMKTEVARFVERLDLEAVILHEMPNAGRTIMEKLEEHSGVDFAIVLLSPDDLGRSATSTEETPRARQNVVFEMGLLIGMLGRDRVCILCKGDVERPSDASGIVYLRYESIEAIKTEVIREMRAAGLTVDANKAL